MRSFYSMWNLGEQNKGVDAGAVGLVHWDRNVQEAVSPPHLHKTLSRNGILKLLAGDCLHAPTWIGYTALKYTAPRYTAPGYFPPGCFAGFRFSARCSVALPAGRKSLPSSFTKRSKTKLQKFQKGQKHDSRNHRSVVYQFPLNEVMFKTHLLVIIC